MGEENRSLLEEEIKAEIKRLGSLESGSQEHTTAVDSLTKLYKLKLEEDKNAYERLDKIENREIDQESKTAQMAESIKDRYFSSNRTELSPLRHSGVYSVDSDRLRNKPVPKTESSCV